jgi:multicomponent K+:H+ antiporter subunit E
VNTTPPSSQHPRPAAPGWLAHPLLSLLLLVLWLLMQQSLALAHVLSGVVLGLVVPRLVHGFLGPASRVHSVAAAWRLSWVVAWDIVMSNVAVARIVLNLAARPAPAWVRVPLDLRHPTGVMLFASIITMTPGTVSCVVDDESWEILVHALDCDDAQAMAQQMKQRYEGPLREIFERVRT